ncbi:unnamed protein product [Sphenostylis stenocarpa]|uniref:NB-ARC domain-containing protein n=1 Tax=Sphenostylis stenocarpa TaxID=92480 RepID=A0AA86V5Y1_9FABA|nr:unnamed protein product [Sphenostylis stenocarpa]
MNSAEESQKYKEIKQLTEGMQEHKENKPLVLSNEFVGWEYEENVKNMWELLGDDQVFIIGLCGMGGVGKTFLATYMENEIKRKGTFGDVFWINVSQDFSILKLQHNIAETIGVKLNRDDERTRAAILTSELEKRGKSVFILDDVWNYIDLEKVGIPLGLKGNKLIITSRLKHVCQQMDCLPNNLITIHPLGYPDDDDDDGGEAWELFLLRLGHHGTPAILPPEVEYIAKSVVKNSRGLPLAINVMARTMKGRQDDIHWWRHALNKLDKVMEEIFATLKHSYDNLIEKDVKKYFLYCALLPDIYHSDYFIKRIFETEFSNRKGSLEDIFDDAKVIVDKLDDHSLLLRDEECRRMHNLVRKMACYDKMMVKRHEKLKKIPDIEEWTIDLEAVSLAGNNIKEIPESTSPNCPHLSWLILSHNSICYIPDSLFTHMNALTILDLSRNRELKCLPNSLSNLRSLTSLVLSGCFKLEYIPPLGELQALLRLDLSQCSILQVPPEGLENLINLKWLDLSRNYKMLVRGNVLSKLISMRVLDLRYCSGIEVIDVQGMSMLDCFRASFVDQDNYIRYMQEIQCRDYGPKTYLILMGKCEGWMPCYMDPIYLEFKGRRVCFGDCEELPYLLPRDLKELNVTNNDQWECLCGTLSWNNPPSLKKIYISDCRRLKSLLCLSNSCSLCTNIQNLQSLSVYNLEGLTAIGKDVDLTQSLSPRGVFFHLKKLYINDCHKIETLLTPGLVPQLHNLEYMTVSSCYSMKEIFAEHDNGDGNNLNITLPKLITFKLSTLPLLKIVSKGTLVCRSKNILEIRGCPKLEMFPKIQVFCG